MLLSAAIVTVASAQGIGPVGPGAPAAAAKTAKGQKAPAAAGQPAKPDPAAAEQALENGIKSYEAGKSDVAAQTLSTAMQGGALPGPKMARALYFRGLSYKKLGKPAQAISDLTSALWLKGGLSDAERTDALAQREASYREAGIASAPAVTTTAAKATAAQTKPGAAPPAAAASAPATAASATTPPAEPTKTAEASSGSSISGFFGGLFGGGSSESSAAPASAGAATTTGTVGSPPPEPAASSWSSTTKASTGVKSTPSQGAAAAESAPAKPATTKVAAATPPPAAAAPAVAEGKFRLQVAAVRSREEANAVAARLKKEFAKKIGGREPVIDEAAIGNMGTFYRVRVGPYASANEPRQLCITLRASAGFDCLVVTQ